MYNAQSCGECHQNPVTGGISQVTELRAGRFDGSSFVDHPGGSLIHVRPSTPRSRSASCRATTSAPSARRSTSSATASSRRSPTRRFAAIATTRRAQPRPDPRPHHPGAGRRGGRHARGSDASAGRTSTRACVSFSADAYLNEMGITSLVNGHDDFARRTPRTAGPVDAFDTVADPEDDGEDVEVFAHFMRATKAPPRDAALAATPRRPGGAPSSSTQIGCALCHTPAIVTAPAGHRDQRRHLHRPRRRSATRSSTPSATSCSTTWAPATASCRTAARPRATSCGRRRSGACAPATA